MRVYIAINARIPHDKAYAIHVERMREALARRVQVALLTPKELHVPLWHGRGRFWFALSSVLFMLASALFFISRRLAGERFVIYTVDMDTFSYALFPLFGATFAEMHSPKRATWANRFFFSRACGVIATTPHTKDALMRTFAVPETKMIVQPNGVEKEALAIAMPKAQARQALGLSPDEPFALYAGRFYAWKGLEALPCAAGLSTLPIRVLGGTREEFEKVLNMDAGPLLFAGSVPKEKVPLWCAAADVLLVLGTARNDDSYYYTSPMKVFEYLAARRPVVASRTPALQSGIPESLAFWYEPDNAASLAHAIGQSQSAAQEQIEAGYAHAREHTWDKRAGRILAFISATDSLKV